MKINWKEIFPQVIMALFGIFLILIIPYQVVDNSEHSVGPGFFPTASAIIIVVLSVGSVIGKIGKGKAVHQQTKQQVATSKEKRNSKGIWRVVFITAGIFTWIFVIPLLGFFLTTLLATLYLMVVIGNRKKLQIVMVSILFTSGLYYLVEHLLKLSFPEGIM
ncbi:Tripartite tricarboxylate transporter TctB family protein [Alteribacillus persepolensis]|uniref:Tripartite tricarboxylate transporter TctB family protein n=1 Tax=Alteribacillus persepolensis TaxID=568899 RepID=A0A1G8A7G8_9BACI|nr:tripartite tricarboxylate transporter TctB family protein [Alteribacillus persepolensis]SDH16879.1 Tripartite tricarboxylate transporter TctB family protein [Alteribacillus persepolensis]